MGIRREEPGVVPLDPEEEPEAAEQAPAAAS
jgi:hypothetical protein